MTYFWSCAHNFLYFAVVVDSQKRFTLQYFNLLYATSNAKTVRSSCVCNIFKNQQIIEVTSRNDFFYGFIYLIWYFLLYYVIDGNLDKCVVTLS